MFTKTINITQDTLQQSFYDLKLPSCPQLYELSHQFIEHLKKNPGITHFKLEFDLFFIDGPNKDHYKIVLIAKFLLYNFKLLIFLFIFLFLFKYILKRDQNKASSGFEPLKKVLTVPRINHSAMTPLYFKFQIYSLIW